MTPGATSAAGWFVAAGIALASGGAAGTTAAPVGEIPGSSRVVITHHGSSHRLWGVANYRTRRAHLFASYDMTGYADLGIAVPAPVEAIEAAGVSYLRLRSCEVGPCWARKDHSGVPAVVNVDEWATEDPFSLAELIRDIASRGDLDYVRGVRTTRYSGAIDADSLLASISKADRSWAEEMFAHLEQKAGGFGSLPGAAWIDDKGLPRRIEIEELGVRQRWEYYDFGVPARIALPPEADVMSLADLEAFTANALEASR